MEGWGDRGLGWGDGGVGRWRDGVVLSPTGDLVMCV